MPFAYAVLARAALLAHDAWHTGTAEYVCGNVRFVLPNTPNSHDLLVEYNKHLFSLFQLLNVPAFRTAFCNAMVYQTFADYVTPEEDFAYMVNEFFNDYELQGTNRLGVLKVVKKK